MKESEEEGKSFYRLDTGEIVPIMSEEDLQAKVDKTAAEYLDKQRSILNKKTCPMNNSQNCDLDVCAWYIEANVTLGSMTCADINQNIITLLIKSQKPGCAICHIAGAMVGSVKDEDTN